MQIHVHVLIFVYKLLHQHVRKLPASFMDSSSISHPGHPSEQATVPANGSPKNIPWLPQVQVPRTALYTLQTHPHRLADSRLHSYGRSPPSSLASEGWSGLFRVLLSDSQQLEKAFFIRLQRLVLHRYNPSHSGWRKHSNKAGLSGRNKELDTEAG